MSPLPFIFKNPELLAMAMTHRSALNEKKGSQQSNERLEFLGDAVLELIVSHYLFQHFPHLPEGQLTQKRSEIVQTKTLAAAAKRLNLGENLIMSKGEKKAGGASNIGLLANTFEALLGATYLDQGLKKTIDFVYQHLLNQLDELVTLAGVHDFKSELQESWQKRFKTAPKYQLIKTVGPDHAKTFVVKVLLNHQVKGEGEGLSKQAAQQAAAQKALEKIS